jgi:hypothetical protein
MRSILCVAGFALLSSCASVKSSSDSLAGSMEVILSPFQSSSDSSGGGSEQSSRHYQQDVEAYTLIYLGREDDQPSYFQGLTMVAEAHGITDWEAAPETFDALARMVEGDELNGAQVKELELELASLDSAARERIFPTHTP